MKWWLTGTVGAAALLSVLLLFRSPGSPEAQAQPGKAGGERTITTTGTATVIVKPDTVRVSFGVSSAAKMFPDAYVETEKKTRNIMTALKGLKIDGLAVKTAPIQIVTQPPGATPKGVESHQVSCAMSATAKAKTVDALVRHADMILSTAWSNGANTAASPSPSGAGMGGMGGMGMGPGPLAANGSRVELFREDDSDARREALQEAVKVALGHARAVAGSAKFTIRQTVTLTDQPSSPFGGVGFQIPRTDVNGETEIIVSVSVTCNY